MILHWLWFAVWSTHHQWVQNLNNTEFIGVCFCYQAFINREGGRGKSLLRVWLRHYESIIGPLVKEDYYCITEDTETQISSINVVYTFLSSAKLTTVRKLEILENAGIWKYAEKVKIWIQMKRVSSGKILHEYIEAWMWHIMSARVAAFRCSCDTSTTMLQTLNPNP